ncbi:hypothetical protein [Coxiella-like endosymbiont]|nr:hypothetical protein [Coxiella-like endosymbiont]
MESKSFKLYLNSLNRELRKLFRD